jgi:hypothetical protein
MINHNINTEYLDLINDYYDVLMSDNPQQEHLDKIVDLLKRNFLQFYESSKINNYYWHFCSNRTYINTFDERLNHYLNIHDDEGNNEIDFVNSELLQIFYMIKSENINFVDESLLEKIKEETRKKIFFLSSKLPDKENTLITNSIEIFTSVKAKELFKRYLEETKEDKNVLTKISFIYRVMLQDKLIIEHIRPEIFKKEITKPPYNIDIEHSLKTLQKVSSITKINFYKSLKELVLHSVE